MGPALGRSVATTVYGEAYYGEATSSERLVCHAAPGFKYETEFLDEIQTKVLIVSQLFPVHRLMWTVDSAGISNNLRGLGTEEA
jgi:hypothetical protein